MTDLAVSLPQGRGEALGDHLRAFAQRLAQWCGHACHVDMDLQYPGSGWAGHDPDMPPGGYPPGSAILDKRTHMKQDTIDAELRAAFRELNEAARKAAQCAQRARHNQAMSLVVLAGYTAQLLDGSAAGSGVQ